MTSQPFCCLIYTALYEKHNKPKNIKKKKNIFFFCFEKLVSSLVANAQIPENSLGINLLIISTVKSKSF